MASRYTTTKNYPALSFEGYSYRFDKFNASNTKKRWRFRTRDCNGSLYTNNNQGNTDIELFTTHKDHCYSDPERRLVEEVICDLKIKVRTQVTPITILYNESSALLSQNIMLQHDFLCSNKLTLPCIVKGLAISLNFQCREPN